VFQLETRQNKFIYIICLLILNRKKNKKKLKKSESIRNTHFIYNISEMKCKDATQGRYFSYESFLTLTYKLSTTFPML
jgi:hypothetical protein